MKGIYRLVVLTVAGIAALALSGNALATQKIAVTQTTSPASVEINLSQADTDPQPAQIRIYVPTGSSLNATQAAGTVIGTTSGEVLARDLGNIPLPLEGDVVVDNPANHLTDACAPGAHQAVWILRLSVAGQTIALPVYVDPTTGVEAALGSAKQVTLSGLVTQSGRAAVAKVSLLINGKAKASATSNAAGRYSKKVKGTGKRSTFQATVTAAARDLGAEGCANPTQPPIPCVSATAGGFTATSKKITVRF